MTYQYGIGIFWNRKHHISMESFRLESEFSPTGDQPQAISKLVMGAKKGDTQTLLGVTGSGKTFTVANVIEQSGKNTLVISHNKTLAAQLYSELKHFFPDNNVGYFVSFYDYCQPESYMPQTDTYIEKDTRRNETIEKMRLEATAMLLSGMPTVIVATVSCIYSLGNPQDWEALSITAKVDMKISRNELVRKFIDARYERNDTEVAPGNFRVKGDTVDIIPAYSDNVIRISLFGDTIEKISMRDPITMKEKGRLPQITIYPAKHYLTAKDRREDAIHGINEELQDRLEQLPTLERQRLQNRTQYDIEMIEEIGYCSGIENYSRHFDGRNPGEKAFCLLDFFGDDFLLVIDECHVTLPQLHAMYKGDRSRKQQLIDYGFRLPSAYDNRPLKFEEFESYMKNTLLVSATPGPYERKISSRVIEQLVRPTGLVDPPVEVRPTKNQMDNIIQEIKSRVSRSERTLITTLTKRMAEDLAEYLSKKGIQVRYMHSEIEGLQRTELIRQLRLGEFDVLVGINLLREGLDIPEVSLVAILDADKEGFLRNYTSLIQTFGRASRNANGSVIMYADTITKSMSQAMQETKRRRKRQLEYNKRHNITPRTISKPIPDAATKYKDTSIAKSSTDIRARIIELESQMKVSAEQLDFEKAIECRDHINELERELKRRG